MCSYPLLLLHLNSNIIHQDDSSPIPPMTTSITSASRNISYFRHNTTATKFGGGARGGNTTRSITRSMSFGSCSISPRSNNDGAGGHFMTPSSSTGGGSSTPSPKAVTRSSSTRGGYHGSTSRRRTIPVHHMYDSDDDEDSGKPMLFRRLLNRTKSLILGSTGGRSERSYKSYKRGQSLRDAFDYAEGERDQDQDKSLWGSHESIVQVSRTEKNKNRNNVIEEELEESEYSSMVGKKNTLNSHSGNKLFDRMERESLEEEGSSVFENLPPLPPPPPPPLPNAIKKSSSSSSNTKQVNSKRDERNEKKATVGVITRSEKHKSRSEQQKGTESSSRGEKGKSTSSKRKGLELAVKTNKTQGNKDTYRVSSHPSSASAMLKTYGKEKSSSNGLMSVRSENRIILRTYQKSERTGNLNGPWYDFYLI